MNSANEVGIKTSSQQPTPIGISDAVANSSGRLRNAAVVTAVLLVIGLAVGLVPRWRHRAELRVVTRELAKQTVAVVMPAPGKAAAGMLLPAEIKPFLDSPIYA